MRELIMEPQGFSTLRAWPKGLLQELLDSGIALPKAIEIAKTNNLCSYENTVHNLFVNVGKYLAIDFLLGLTRTGLTYHAIGGYDNTPAVTDTTLYLESARNTITSASRSGTQMILSTYFSAAMSTLYIKEAGVFGNGATAALNSGDLFCRYLQAFDNSDGLNDLTFEYTFTL